MSGGRLRPFRIVDESRLQYKAASYEGMMLDRATTPKQPAQAITPNASTLPELFLARAAKTPHSIAYRRKLEREWVASTWRDFAEASASLATFLLNRGVGLGDKLTIVGSTRPEWCVSDVGGLLAGAITVGAYPTLTADQLAYILDHSDSKLLLVEDLEQLSKVIAKKASLPKLVLAVLWDSKGAEQVLSAHPWVVPLERVLATKPDRARIDERAAQVQPEHTAIIVYTSGTTGPPKGAMISHQNILTLLSGSAIVDFDQDDSGLSFLPMAHVAERVLAFYGRINHGTATAFATSVPAVLEEVKEVRPTIFGSVPRIFEKAYARVQAEVDKAPPVKQQVFRWAERTGLELVDLWQRGQPIPLGLRVRHRIADRLVFSKLRNVFGGRVKFFVTGAAPIPRRILEFFWAAGFPIYEVYGMTEATVVTHVNRPGAVRLGSVGKALPFVEERLADDGEILLRGPTVFQGYYKAPEATAETIDADGWLHTGDIGKRDDDGFLYIVDRKKHIIITAGGKNLTPANIENEIKTEDPIISQVHAHGDGRPYVTALVTVSPIEAIEWAREHGKLAAGVDADRMKRALMENPLATPDGLAEVLKTVTAEPELRRRIAQAVQRGNQKLSRVEQVKRVLLLDRELSLEQDEITPTLKVKRKNVEKKLVSAFDRLYEDDSFGITVMDE
jgi:long-chain acyl-CoA synthetase